MRQETHFKEYELLSEPVEVSAHLTRCIAQRPNEQPVMLYRTPALRVDVEELTRRVLPAFTVEHENVMRLSVGSGTTDVLFFVEELGEGMWLQEILDAKIEVPPLIAAQIARGVAKGFLELRRSLPWEQPPDWELNPRSIFLSTLHEVKVSFSGVAHHLEATLRELSGERVKGAPTPALRYAVYREQRSLSMPVMAMVTLLYEMLTGQALPEEAIESIFLDGRLPDEILSRVSAPLSGILSGAAEGVPIAVTFVTLDQYLTSQESLPSVTQWIEATMGGRRSVQLPLLHREVGRLNAIRWFQPDAEMEALTPESVQWLEARLDEHFALLQSYSSAELPSRRVTLLRSCIEAHRVASAIEGGRTKLSRTNNRWKQALREAVRQLKPSSSQEDEMLLAKIYGRLLFVPKTLETMAQRALKNVLECSHHQKIIQSHLRHTLSFGDETPSPFTPLLQMYERGAWPLTMGEKGFLIYVPIYQGGALVLG